MLKDLRGLSIDRDRAIRMIALAGLLILGLVTLPGLLKTPAPPPVPPDVGFTQRELARDADPSPRQQPRDRPDRAAEVGKPVGGKAPADAGRKSLGKAKRQSAPKPKRIRETPEDEIPAGPAASPVSAAPSATVASPPVPAPSAPAPGPTASPAPPAAPPAIPADGSEEFAPR